MAKRPLNKLRMGYDKRKRDIVYWHPDGPDGSGVAADSMVLHAMLTVHHRFMGETQKSFQEELEARGYDLTTLRFSIAKKADHPRWKDGGHG